MSKPSILVDFRNSLSLLAGLAACSLLVSTASAHHISGSVVCKDTAPPTPLSGVLVTATGSLNTYQTSTKPDGSFEIGLEQVTDNYTVVIDVPAGLSIVSPASGKYEVQIIAGCADGPSSCVFEQANFELTGCSPGEGCPVTYWKDKKTIGDKDHPTKWVGYSPDAIINSVFANATKQVCPGYGDDGKKKLRDAINWGTATGTLKDAFHNLMREAVAALLNAANPQINYPATEAEIILMVNDALASCDKATLISLANDLKAANNLGSPACRNTSNANCTTDGRPNKLTLTYLGTDCASAHNSQQPPAYTTKYACAESNGGLTGVAANIIVTGSSTPPTPGSARYFDGIVNVGDTFDVLAGSSSFGANTYIYIYEGGLLKQFVQMHTSCSAPLVRTETFGGLQLEDYAIVP